MRKSFKQPVQSDFGYTSPFFNVDSLGNITATSLTLSEESIGIEFDYEFLETVDGIISIVGQTGSFPTVTISKTETVYFGLTLTSTGLYILEDDGETLFSGNMGMIQDSEAETLKVKVMDIIQLTFLHLAILRNYFILTKLEHNLVL